MVLRVNSSDDDKNITLGMYGEYCHSVQDLPVFVKRTKVILFTKIDRRNISF